MINRLAALVTMLFCAPLAVAESPNVILLVVDDLPDRLCNYVERVDPPIPTPHLDKLAAEGVVLTSMHSPSPICTPSRFAILSGRFPSTARNQEFVKLADQYGQTFVAFNTHLVAGDRTLAHAMHERGYFTGAVGKNHVIESPGHKHLPYTSDTSRDDVKQTLLRNDELLKQAFHEAGFDHAERLYFGNPDADGVRDLAVHNQDWITEGAIRFLAQREDRPFFLYMATTLPHGPFEPERSWSGDRRIIPTGRLEAPPEVQPPAGAIAARLEATNDKRWNVGNLIWLDDAVGSLVEELDRQGVLDSTILLFVSDHGTLAKGSVYDQGTRTPAFVWRKGGFPAGDRLEAPLSLVDLMPTILDFTGTEAAAAPESRFAGRSFAPQLLGERVDSAERPMYFEVGFTRGVSLGRFKYIALRLPDEIANMSLEERKERLEVNNRRLALHGRPIANRDPAAPFSHLTPVPGGDDAERVSIGRYPSYFEHDQLYDLSSDPGEQSNLADDPAYAETLRRMQSLLSQAVEELPGDFPVFESNGSG